MKPVAIAYRAREVLALPPESTVEAVERATALGFWSLWILADDAEQASALPLTVAAIGSRVPRVRLGVRLIPYARAARIAEDVSVLDNLLGGRVIVALKAEGSLRGGGWTGLGQLRALRDVLNGSPLDLRPHGIRDALAVSPRSPQFILQTWLWFDAEAQASDALPAVRAGIPVIVERALLTRTGKHWALGTTAPLVEVVESGSAVMEPIADSARARIVLMPGVDLRALEKIASALMPHTGANASQRWPSAKGVN
jgi:hypothetical protein